MNVSAFVRLVTVGVVLLAVVGCGGDANGDIPSILSHPPSAPPTPDPLTTCLVAREAQQTFSDISAGYASAVGELERVVMDAESLASSAEAANEVTVSSDATTLSQDADTLSKDGSVTSTAQLQGESGLTQLSLDAQLLMFAGNC